MKIEKWQVENGIAKPVNHYSSAPMITANEMEFEQFIRKLPTYHTDASAGIHSAEMFGEVFEQINYYGTWQTLLKSDIIDGHEIRSFLPYNQPMAFQPLNPNANAIKIVSDRIEELRKLNDQYDQYNIFDRIGELQDILKLLQS